MTIKTMKTMGIFLVLLVLTLHVPLLWAEEGSATPQEVIAKVKEAAAFLAEKGEDGPAAFRENLKHWVWKDTYVWILDCDQWTVLVHPNNPKLEGNNLKLLKDTEGKLFFIEFCLAAKKPKGGWVDYMWPKPGEEKPCRKISYTLQVPDRPYQVGAGIYNNDLTVRNSIK
jgi:cytochrome c